MQKSIIIIGAGMGGMAAGIYGQMTGIRQVFLKCITSLAGNALHGPVMVILLIPVSTI